MGPALEGDWGLRRRWVWKDGERPERFRLGIRTGAGECRRCSVGGAMRLAGSVNENRRPSRSGERRRIWAGWMAARRAAARAAAQFPRAVLLALDLPESVPQFAAERLGDIQQDAAVFGQREQAEPLAIVHRHHFQRGRQ